MNIPWYFWLSCHLGNIILFISLAMFFGMCIQVLRGKVPWERIVSVGTPAIIFILSIVTLNHIVLIDTDSCRPSNSDTRFWYWGLVWEQQEWAGQPHSMVPDRVEPLILHVNDSSLYEANRADTLIMIRTPHPMSEIAQFQQRTPIEEKWNTVLSRKEYFYLHWLVVIVFLTTIIYLISIYASIEVFSHSNDARNRLVGEFSKQELGVESIFRTVIYATLAYCLSGPVRIATDVLDTLRSFGWISSGPDLHFVSVCYMGAICFFLSISWIFWDISVLAIHYFARFHHRVTRGLAAVWGLLIKHVTYAVMWLVTLRFLSAQIEVELGALFGTMITSVLLISFTIWLARRRSIFNEFMLLAFGKQFASWIRGLYGKASEVANA